MPRYLVQVRVTGSAMIEVLATDPETACRHAEKEAVRLIEPNANWDYEAVGVTPTGTNGGEGEL